MSYRSFRNKLLYSLYVEYKKNGFVSVTLHELINSYSIEFEGWWLARVYEDLKDQGFVKDSFRAQSPIHQSLMVKSRALNEVEELIEKGEINIDDSGNVINYAHSDIVDLSKLPDRDNLILAVTDFQREVEATNALSYDEKEVARGELKVLQQILNQKFVRIQNIIDFSKRTLRWIADKAAGATVSEMAKQLLEIFLKSFG